MVVQLLPPEGSLLSLLGHLPELYVSHRAPSVLPCVLHSSSKHTGHTEFRPIPLKLKYRQVLKF